MDICHMFMRLVAVIVTDGDQNLKFEFTAELILQKQVVS